jgi:hypothetical protein
MPAPSSPFVLCPYHRQPHIFSILIFILTWT